MDDYYELLGIDGDAPVDDIRAAYRDRKDALAADPDAKSDVAALNKAWNVLSDPYQRGRYDQQLDAANASGDDDDDDDDEDEAPAPVKSVKKKAERPATRAEARRNARGPLKPTVKLPAGLYFPTTRRRLTAMMIDLTVLLVLFIASQLVAQSVDRAMHKPIVDRIDSLHKGLIDATTKSSDLGKKAKAAESNATNVAAKRGASSSEIADAQATAKSARDTANKASKAVKKDQKAYDDEFRKLVPLNTAVAGGFFLVGLLYLVIPSALTGQTIGKRSQHVRVIRVDGSPLGLGWSLRRYGLLVLVTFALLFETPFGALGAALVLFGVTTWTRNPNQQGLHDRLVKTLVVTEIAP